MLIAYLSKIAEQERKRQELREHEQELLRQRVEQDQRFHANNLQKAQRRAQEAKEIEKFLKAQMVSMQACMLALCIFSFDRLKNQKEKDWKRMKKGCITVKI